MKVSGVVQLVSNYFFVTSDIFEKGSEEICLGDGSLLPLVSRTISGLLGRLVDKNRLIGQNVWRLVCRELYSAIWTYGPDGPRALPKTTKFSDQFL